MSRAPSVSIDDLLDVPKDGQRNGELEIQQQIRLELGNPTRYPDVLLFRNNVGVLQTLDGRYVRYGLAKGSSDLIGIFTTSAGLGLFIAAEVKSEHGKESDEQKRFSELVGSRGGEYVVLRSVEEAREWIARLRSGK